MTFDLRSRKHSSFFLYLEARNMLLSSQNSLLQSAAQTSEQQRKRRCKSFTWFSNTARRFWKNLWDGIARLLCLWYRLQWNFVQKLARHGRFLNPKTSTQSHIISGSMEVRTLKVVVFVCTRVCLCHRRIQSRRQLECISQLTGIKACRISEMRNTCGFQCTLMWKGRDPKAINI